MTESVGSCTSLASGPSVDCGDEVGPQSPPAGPVAGSGDGHIHVPPANGHDEEQQAGITTCGARTQSSVSKQHSTLKEFSSANRLLRKFRSINDFHVSCSVFSHSKPQSVLCIESQSSLCISSIRFESPHKCYIIIIMITSVDTAPRALEGLLPILCTVLNCTVLQIALRGGASPKTSNDSSPKNSMKQLNARKPGTFDLTGNAQHCTVHYRKGQSNAL